MSLPELAGYHDVGNRAVFVIDKSQKVIHKEIPERGTIPDAEAALNAVRGAA